MKQVITKLSIIAMVVSLTACSTNTQKENTVVGAGTGAVVGGLLGTLAHGAGSGWVIAAGAVVGGLVGGYIGHNMDSADTSQMNNVMDHNAVNQPSKWTNSSTGTSYMIVPTSHVTPYKGSSFCRHYSAYAVHDGKTTKTKAVACRDSDGNWKQVR